MDVIHSDKPGGPHATFLACKMCYATGNYIMVHPADVDPSNGVVQIIDQVLIPPDFVWPSKLIIGVYIRGSCVYIMYYYEQCSEYVYFDVLRYIKYVEKKNEEMNKMKF